MNKVLILGDVHLGKGANLGKIGVGSTINSRIFDQFNLLDWVLDQAIDSCVSNIIITGDIFEEPNPHSSLIVMFINWLKKCQINNIIVDIIIGNHDVLRCGVVYTSSLDIITESELENVNIYKNINTILINTSAFTLMPFRDRKSFNCKTNNEAISILQESLVYELASIPITYKKYLIGHLAIQGSIPVGNEISDLVNELYCPFDMFNGYDYIFMGHVHGAQILSKKPYTCHIGSMDVSNFGETDQKKHIVIIDCVSNEIETKQLPTRRLKKINIVVPKEIKDTTKFVLEELDKGNFDKSLVKVDIVLEDKDLQSVNKLEVEDFLLKKGAFNVSGISQSKKISLVKNNKNTLDNKMDITFALHTYADMYVCEDKKEKFLETAIEIYNSLKINAPS